MYDDCPSARSRPVIVTTRPRARARARASRRRAYWRRARHALSLACPEGRSQHAARATTAFGDLLVRSARRRGRLGRSGQRSPLVRALRGRAMRRGLPALSSGSVWRASLTSRPSKVGLWCQVPSVRLWRSGRWTSWGPPQEVAWHVARSAVFVCLLVWSDDRVVFSWVRRVALVREPVRRFTGLGNRPDEDGGTPGASPRRSDTSAETGRPSNAGGAFATRRRVRRLPTGRVRLDAVRAREEGPPHRARRETWLFDQPGSFPCRGCYRSPLPAKGTGLRRFAVDRCLRVHRVVPVDVTATR